MFTLDISKCVWILHIANCNKRYSNFLLHNSIRQKIEVLFGYRLFHLAKNCRPTQEEISKRMRRFVASPTDYARFF